MRINDVLRAKAGQQVVTISPEASVGDLVDLLREHNIGAVVVSTDGTSVDGIASERDVVRNLGATDALDRPVATIMTASVHTCSGDDEINDLMQQMTEHRIRHVPVVADTALTGIISIGDVVKNRISELEFERDQLDQYLHQS